MNNLKRKNSQYSKGKNGDSKIIIKDRRNNVKENEKAYVMEVAAPGIKKECCRINVDQEGNLSLSIENKSEHKEENKKQHYLRREFSYSNYEQTYTLPEDVNREGIEAKVDNGILTVTLPKVSKEEKQKNTRAIEVS